LTARQTRSRPVESYSGAQETLIAVPYHNFIPYAPRLRRQKRREGRNMGRGVPSPPDYGSRERRKLPCSEGPGRSPGRKWILCISEVIKKPSGRPFSVFFSDSRAPQTSRGPGKLPPLDGPDKVCTSKCPNTLCSEKKHPLTFSFISP